MTDAVGGAPQPERVRPYAWWVLFVLFLVSVANYYDRNLLPILVQPIEKELGLTDSQIGLLTGVGFALVYSFASVPIARFADRGRRVGVLSAVLAVWSVMTALTGFATGFLSMLGARVGVAVGEAGGLPTTHALVAEYFPPKRRATALAVIGVAGAFGISLATLGGGLIAQHFSWRAAFWSALIPGLVLSALVLFTIREPRRSPSDAPKPAQAPFGETFKVLMRRKSFLWGSLGIGVASIGGYGAQSFTPAFLMRSYHLSVGETATLYTAFTGPALLIGTLASGVICDWLTARDRRWPLWLITIAFALTLPSSLGLLLAPDLKLALAFSAPSTLLGALFIAPSYAIVQMVSGSKNRATAAALYLLLINVLGLSLGPWLTGALSEALTPRFGVEALRYALLGVSGFNLIGAVMTGFASLWLRRDAAEADAEDAADRKATGAD